MKTYKLYIVEADNGKINTGLTEQQYTARYSAKDRSLMGTNDPVILEYPSKDAMEVGEKGVQDFFEPFGDHHNGGSKEVLVGVPLDVVEYKARILKGENPEYIGMNPLVRFTRDLYRTATDQHTSNDSTFRANPHCGYISRNRFDLDVFQTRESGDRLDSDNVKNLTREMERHGWKPGSVICTKGSNNIGGNHRLESAKNCIKILEVPNFEVPLDLSDEDLYTLGEKLNIHKKDIHKSISKDVWLKKLRKAFWKGKEEYSPKELRVAVDQWIAKSEELADEYPLTVKDISSTLNRSVGLLETKHQNIVDNFVPVTGEELENKVSIIEANRDVKCMNTRYDSGQKDNIFLQIGKLSYKNYVEGPTALVIRFKNKASQEEYMNNLELREYIEGLDFIVELMLK